MVKAVFTGNKQTISKNLNAPKNGFVQKKKNNKPKQTPVGKIALINGSKARNNKNVKQQNLQKQTSNLSPKSIEKNTDQNKKHNPNNDKQKGTPPQKELNKKKITLVEEKDDSDSEIDDINEGVVLEDQSMVDESENCEDEEQSDDDDDESEEEKSVPNILGHSLADESDDDDDDYEAEEEEEMKSVQSKQGVKMFTGSKQLNSSGDSVKNSLDNSALEETLTDESIEENDDNLEEEEEEDGDEEDQTDDEDGDDYNEELEEEDSNQGEDEDESEDEDEGEDEDEDDDEQEEEDEDEADESALGLKALLDNTIADDDEDDEDFVESGENDEDDDISDEEDEEEEEDGNNTLDNSQQNANKEGKADTSIEKIKLDKRTIFVGNLPVNVKKGPLNKLFKKFGTIETIRLRGMVAKSLNMSKKVAAKTKNIHPKLKSVYAYILFDSEKSAKSALAMNGTMFEGNYLRVDIADTSEKKYDSKKSVFVGNLNFRLDDNKFREHFAQCGEIESVRIVKDSKTGVNRGIGFINFKTEDAATLALELDGTTLLNREIRVKPNYKANENNKQKHGKRSLSSDSEHNVVTKKSKNNEAVAVSNATKRIKAKEQSGKKQTSPQQVGKKQTSLQQVGKKQTSPQQGKMFEGQKADASKKKKKNKLDKKKKILAEKLAAKPKKPSN